MTKENIEKGFNNCLNYLDDLVIDIPDAPIFICNLISQCLINDCISFSFLENSLKYLINTNNEKVQAAEIITEILSIINKSVRFF